MSNDDRPVVEVGFAGGMFVLGVFALIALFYGDPDLHDAIIAYLMRPC